MTDRQEALPKWEMAAESYHKDRPNEDLTYRLKVPGGWLYRVVEQNGTSMAFVPEPHTTKRHRRGIADQ